MDENTDKNQSDEHLFRLGLPELSSLVVCANNLVEARYKLTTIEHKIIAHMIAANKPNDDEFHPVVFKVSDLAERIGLVTDGAYSAMKKITRSLLKREFIIRLKTGEHQFNWISAAKYRDKEGEVELVFNHEITRWLLKLKEQFLCYKLCNVLPLTNANTIRIYELLKQYEHIGTRTISVSGLKMILEIPRKQYTDFKDFKKRVLIPAQESIIEHTDITFTMTFRKRGRYIMFIIFEIQTKNKAVEKVDGEIPENIIQMIPEHLQSSIAVKKLIRDAISAHGVCYIERNIAYTNKELKDQRKYRAYLAKAIENDWGLGYSEDVNVIKAQLHKTIGEDKKQIENLQELMAIRSEVHNRCREALKRMSETEISEHEKQFMATRNQYDKKKYDRYGLHPQKTAVLTGFFLDWLNNKL